MEVIVPEEQLLLAIGKKGQNVKLASKLVGWHIEVRAEGHVEDALKRAEGLFAPKKADEGEAGPGEAVPGEAPPGEQAPGEAAPVETAPGEAVPDAGETPAPGDPSPGDPGNDASR
jgi:N utilization substance protein A